MFFQVYLTISDDILRQELFRNALKQFESSPDNHFQRESILDIIRILVLYQNAEDIALLFDTWVYPLSETVLGNPKKGKKIKKEKENEGEMKEEEEKKNELR